MNQTTIIKGHFIETWIGSRQSLECSIIVSHASQLRVTKHALEYSITVGQMDAGTAERYSNSNDRRQWSFKPDALFLEVWYRTYTSPRPYHKWFGVISSGWSREHHSDGYDHSPNVHINRGMWCRRNLGPHSLYQLSVCTNHFLVRRLASKVVRIALLHFSATWFLPHQCTISLISTVFWFNSRCFCMDHTIDSIVFGVFQ
jgi:hypothetical protein